MNASPVPPSLLSPSFPPTGLRRLRHLSLSAFHPRSGSSHRATAPRSSAQKHTDANLQGERHAAQDKFVLHTRDGAARVGNTMLLPHRQSRSCAPLRQATQSSRRERAEQDSAERVIDLDVDRGRGHRVDRASLASGIPVLEHEEAWRRALRLIVVKDDHVVHFLHLGLLQRCVSGSTCVEQRRYQEHMLGAQERGFEGRWGGQNGRRGGGG
eukprot:429864-Rhodomonas_salina.1